MDDRYNKFMEIHRVLKLIPEEKKLLEDPVYTNLDENTKQLISYIRYLFRPGKLIIKKSEIDAVNNLDIEKNIKILESMNSESKLIFNIILLLICFIDYINN